MFKTEDVVYSVALSFILSPQTESSRKSADVVTVSQPLPPYQNNFYVEGRAP